MPKRSNGFDKNPQRASLAGKKSKRPALQDLKEARMLNANEFESSIYKYMNMDINSLKRVYEDMSVSARDKIVIKILVLALEKGDFMRLNFLLERTIGKVTDKVQFSGKIETYKDIRLRMEGVSDEEATQRYFEMLKAGI
jgi:ribosomal protein L10